MFEYKKISLSLALGAAIGLTLDANEIALNAIEVVSATGYEQKIVEAPASISVVGQEELKTRPYTSLLDAVREIEGVDIGESRDKTGQGSVSIRGMGGDYTLLLIDGKRQNNVGDIYPNNFGGNQQNHIPPLGMIERVEIIRGPMATLYGADAIGGVVNIITKKISKKWVGSINISQSIQSNNEYGNEKTVDIAVMGPLIKDKLGLSIRASKYDKEASNPTYDDTIDPDGNTVPRELLFGSGGRTVASDNYNIGASLAYKPHKDHEIVLDIETSNQEYDNSASELGTSDSTSGLPYTGYSDKQEFERSQWSISHEGDWGFIKNKVSIYEITTKNMGRTLPLTAAERLDVNNIMGTNDFADLTPGEQASLEQFLPRPDRILETKQLTVDAKLDISLEEHQIVLGMQYIDAEMEDGVFGMTDTSGHTSGKVQPHKQWAIFAEENWFLTDSFTLTAGARYDKHDVFGSNTSPRIYGVYNFLDDFTIKGGVGTGYKTPKTSDLFDGIIGFGRQGTLPLIGNSDLKAEKSVNTEIAFYYENKNKDAFNITFFRNNFNDKIQNGPSVDSFIGADWAALGYTSFTQKINIDRAIIRGIEVAGKYNINPEIALRANYTYLDSEQKNGEEKGLPLSGNAEHMYNVAIDYKPTPEINTYLILTGEKNRYGGIPRGGDVNDAFWYKDFNVLNAGVTYKANENVIITGRINNLLDKDFTGYSAQFIKNGGKWDATYQDDYNTKAKSREFWVSVNVKI